MAYSTVIWCADPGSRNFRIHHVTQRGVHVSPSFVQEMLQSQPTNNGAYQAFYTSCERERCFEIIRQRHYRHQPSRLGALFAFPDLGSACDAAQETWNDRRECYRAEVLEGSRVMLADRIWLSAALEDCVEAAHLYFKGTMSIYPKPELLIHGGIRAEMIPLEQGLHPGPHPGRACRGSGHRAAALV